MRSPQFIAFQFVLISFLSVAGFSVNAQKMASPEAAPFHLLKPLQDLQESQMRGGPWRLSKVVCARYGFPVNSGFDSRLDVAMSTAIAGKWWNDLFAQYGDSSSADYALIYGPSRVQRDLMADAALAKRWSAERRKWLKRSRLLATEGDEWIRVDGPLRWNDLTNMIDKDTESWRSDNPAVQGEGLARGEWAYLRLQDEIEEQKLSRLRRKAELQDSLYLADLQRSRDRLSKGIPDPRTHDTRMHRVSSGEFLGAIARRYGVSVKELKKWNGLRSDMIRIGQELVIYVDKGAAETVVASADTQEEKRELDPEASVRADEEDRKEMYYSIRSGDTLWSIARAYPGVSPDDIMRWNGIDENIKPGQVLLILPPNRE